jgi:hypothetical protein
MVATLVLLLVQEPPEPGLIDELLPAQIEFGPVILTIGLAYTAIGAVLLDIHPVAVLVK